MFDTPDENKAEVEQITSAGAYVMGRNMFGPVRGEWDLDWRGWWGDDPHYHAPVFVLTDHQRDPVTMRGGTTFTFVTDGINSALDQARAAAGERDVAIAGGAATVNQYLAAGLIHELRTHIAPVTLGAGERLFDGAGPLHLELLSAKSASLVTHVSCASPAEVPPRQAFLRRGISSQRLDLLICRESRASPRPSCKEEGANRD
jgi:dihydrofolate reductase